MKSLITLFLFGISISGFAQTKLIFHKSHSGKNSTFRAAVEGNLFGTSKSNFGLEQKTMVRLDSVIFINQNKTIVVTSELYYTSDRVKAEKEKDPKHWIKKRNTYTNSTLFANPHLLDSIKKQIQVEKKYDIIKGVVFVGFDNKKSKK